MTNEEKVRELVYKLLEPENYNSIAFKEIITEWLEQNQPKPVVVGLTDEQVKELANEIYEMSSVKDSMALVSNIISDYLKTLTFSQPQQLKPNWGNAPDFANWLAQDSDGQWQWFETKPIPTYTGWGTDADYSSADLTIKDWRQTLEQRPTPPAPKVEVGQVWKYVDLQVLFEVKDVTDTNIHCTRAGGITWDGSLEDFLSKFELVGE